MGSGSITGTVRSGGSSTCSSIGDDGLMTWCVHCGAGGGSVVSGRRRATVGRDGSGDVVIKQDVCVANH